MHSITRLFSQVQRAPYLTCSSPIQTRYCADEGYSCSRDGNLQRPSKKDPSCEGLNGCYCDVTPGGPCRVCKTEGQAPDTDGVESGDEVVAK